MFCGDDKFAVFEKNEIIHPEMFKKDVKEAMKTEPQYNVLTFNCIHFALNLLGVDSEVMYLI